MNLHHLQMPGFFQLIQALVKNLDLKAWLGMSFPKEYGGHQRTALERYVVTEELLSSGAPVAAHWIADRQSGSQILRYGNEKQKSSIIPRITACFFAIGMSEPDSGSDLKKRKPPKLRMAGNLRVEKYGLLAHLAHYMIVLARKSSI